MKIILLENIRNLGKFGDQVTPRSKGFARNFLIPQGKAVAATRENVAKFESRRAELEAKATAALQAAQEKAAELNNLHVVISARAGEEGKLYGSINKFDLVKAFQEKGVEVAHQAIRLPQGALRETGEFSIEIQCHPEVLAYAKVTITSQKGEH